MKTAPYGRRAFWLIASLTLALGLLSAHAYAQTPICTPSTTPCQTCPDPPPCPPPTTTTCPPPGGGNVTFTNSTVTCTGSFAQDTVTTTSAIGPGNICVGPNKSVGFFVCPGTVNFNTNTDTIVAGVVAIPTLSVWGLCALIVGLGALALRRLRTGGPARA